MKCFALWLVVVLLIYSCSRLEIRKSSGPDDEGLPFYKPYPYLLVALNDQGYCTASILYLPMFSEEYRIIPHAGWGSTTFNPTLTNGWNLTGFSSTLDSKTADNITAIGGVVGTLATAVAPLKAVKPEPGEKIGPGLYRFTYDQNNQFITGVQPVMKFIAENGKALSCEIRKPGTPQPPKKKQKE